MIDISNTDLSNNNIDIDNIKRVNRDMIRNIFYDKTDKYYNLNFDENKYDLSNNKF